MTPLQQDVRRVFAGTQIAHVATVLPDGSPHSVPVWVDTHGEQLVFMTGPGSRKARNLRRDQRVALSVAPAEDPSTPVLVRGRVIEFVDGDAGWEIVDRISMKYTGGPYPRHEPRIALIIEPERQTVGVR
jgi:PPOX class probable F420-dependent enzyme